MPVASTFFVEPVGMTILLTISRDKLLLLLFAVFFLLLLPCCDGVVCRELQGTANPEPGQ